jgi:hypothetical protein
MNTNEMVFVALILFIVHLGCFVNGESRLLSLYRARSSGKDPVDGHLSRTNGISHECDP